MSGRLLHGILLGAALGCVWSVLEALRLMPDHPYQVDPAVWVGPALVIAGLGAVCGLIGAIAMRWTVPAGLRERSPQWSLAAPVLAICVTAICAMLARTDWMPADARLGSSYGVRAMLTALAAGAASHVAVLLLARLRLAWALASAVSLPTAAIVLAATGIGALVCWVLPQRPAPLAARAMTAARDGAPNVMLVVLDTVRADHLGCYGYDRPTGPRLDALSADGVRFEQAYAAAPWTLPSHASLFTGLHPQTHGTGWEHPRLHDGRAGIDGVTSYDFPVLAEELGSRGYATFGASSKSWIRHQTGLTQGFAEYCDLSQPSLADSFLIRRLLLRYTGESEDLAVRMDKGGQDLIDRTLGWLDDGRPSDRPFFSFLNLNEAHDPYYPPAKFWTRFLPEGVAVEDTKPRALDQSTEYRRANWEGKERYSDAEIEILKALYDAEILYQDGLLGELIDGLQARGLLDNTLLIITSDHGEEFLETGNRIGHQMSLSDRLVRVPLIMHWPAGLSGTGTVPSMASLVDVFPTVLELTAGSAEEAGGPPVEGVSLVPAITGESASVRDFVIAHYDNPTSFLTSAFSWDSERPEDFALAPLMRRITILRSANTKFYGYGDGLESLVDLAADPLEVGADTPYAPEFAATAGLYRTRLMQQVNDYRRRHETVFGHIHAFRAGTTSAAGPGGVPAHELGYASGGEAPVDSGAALPPYLGFR